MLKTLENDILRLTVDTHGAEIHSLVAKDTGIEYIWQVLAKTCANLISYCW